MATKQQIPVLVARLTEFQEEFSILPTEDAQWVIMNGKDAAALCAKAIASRPKERARQKITKAEASVLSDVISSTTIPATTEKFIVKEKFDINTNQRDKVKLSYISPNFNKWFLEKVEEPFNGSTVCGRKVKQYSFDGPILSELGRQKKAETTLSEVFAMIERQPNGEGGALDNCDFSNIFYVRDSIGKLRVVSIHFGFAGWDIKAFSVEKSEEWADGHQVFSRN